MATAILHGFIYFSDFLKNDLAGDRQSDLLVSVMGLVYDKPSVNV